MSSKSRAGLSIGATAVVVFLLAVLFFNPFKRTMSNEVALSYGGGAFEGAEYQGVVNPGSGLHFNGWFDKWYVYKTDQRDYTVSDDESPLHGNGLLAVAEEFYRTSEDDIRTIRSTTAFNVHQVGERATPDIIQIIPLP